MSASSSSRSRPSQSQTSRDDSMTASSRNTGLRQSSNSEKISLDGMPEKCKTWFYFKEEYDARFSDKDSAEQYTANERLGYTRQARDLVSLSITALDQYIRESRKSDSRSSKQDEEDRRQLKAMKMEKQSFDRELAMLGPRVDKAQPVEQKAFAGVRKLDDKTMRIIAGLSEQEEASYAERKRNRGKQRGKDLVYGTQILDDITEALIDEFNRELALEENKSKSKKF